MLELTQLVGADFDLKSATQNNSHLTYTAGKHFIKFNKGGEARISLIEFHAHKIIQAIVGREHIPDIDLVFSECKETGIKHIVGVAVTTLSEFTEFTDINIINLIAEMESQARKDVRYQAMTPLEKLYDPMQADRSDIWRKHFKDKPQERIAFFKTFIQLLFIRYLLKEDDGHKGNYGFVDSDDQLDFFMLDFDNLVKNISADLDIVRLSQYGSPHDKFKLTHKDFERFPLIEDCKPGHFVGIESNSFEAQSISPNRGRTTREDKAALVYLLSLPEFAKARDEGVCSALGKFIHADMADIISPLREYSGLKLKSCYQVELTGDELIDFTDVFHQELAVTQIQVCKLVEEVSVGETQLADYLNESGVTRDAQQKGEPWYAGQVLGDKIEKLINYFEGYHGLDMVEQLIQQIEKLNNDKRYHYDLAFLKERTVDLAKVVVERCNAKQLREFVEWRNALSPNYITQARKAGFWSRKFKKHLFNTMTSTNVSLRDLAKKRALVLRAQGTEMADTINLLLARDSLLDSHSLCPLTFSERFQYRFIPLFLANFSSKSMWQNYLDEKMDFERHTPFLVVSIVKDIVKFVHEFVMFLLEFAAYRSRRYFSDQARLSQGVIGYPWKLLCTLGAFVSLIAHYSIKAIARVLRLVTSPFMSAEKLKVAFQNAAQMFCMAESNIEAAGKVGYIVSLMLSSALFVVGAKFIAMGLIVAGSVKAGLVLSNAFGLFSIWVGSLFGLYMLHPDGSDQPYIKKPSQLGFNFAMPNEGDDRHIMPSPVARSRSAHAGASLPSVAASIFQVPADGLFGSPGAGTFQEPADSKSRELGAGISQVPADGLFGRAGADSESSEDDGFQDCVSVASSQ